jgi:hypothetical protein
MEFLIGRHVLTLATNVTYYTAARHVVYYALACVLGKKYSPHTALQLGFVDSVFD